jgi:hypothetical protein
MGQRGVNVDNNPLDLEDDQLTRSQNAVTDPASGASTLRKRPGFAAFTASLSGSNILGGSPLPGPNSSSGGTVSLYIGRSPSS